MMSQTPHDDAVVNPPKRVRVPPAPFTHSVPHRITPGVTRSRGCGCADGGAGALAEVRVRWRGPFLSTFSEAHVEDDAETTEVPMVVPALAT